MAEEFAVKSYDELQADLAGYKEQQQQVRLNAARRRACCFAACYMHRRLPPHALPTHSAGLRKRLQPDQGHLA
jgi:hypothetical protein